VKSAEVGRWCLSMYSPRKTVCAPTGALLHILYIFWSCILSAAATTLQLYTPTHTDCAGCALGAKRAVLLCVRGC
jgi:hypothetical protein